MLKINFMNCEVGSNNYLHFFFFLYIKKHIKGSNKLFKVIGSSLVNGFRQPCIILRQACSLFLFSCYVCLPLEFATGTKLLFQCPIHKSNATPSEALGFLKRPLQKIKISLEIS